MDNILNTLVSLTIQFSALVGVAALIASVINLFKILNIVKDDTSQYWSAGLNLVAFIVLALVGVFKPDLSAAFLDQYAEKIATVITFILGLATMLVGAPLWHKGLSAGKVPLIGKSFTVAEKPK